MKVILKKDYDLVGDEGQIVEVKNGYARNFLIPRGIATLANSGNLKNYEEIKRQKGRKIKKQIEELQSISEKLSKYLVSISVKTGEENKIFGSVTAQMIHDNLVNNGFESIDRKKIILKEAIKTLGEHEVEIKLQHGVIAKLKVNVLKESTDENSDSGNETAAEEVMQSVS